MYPTTDLFLFGDVCPCQFLPECIDLMLLLASLLSLFEPNLRLVECVLQIFNGTRFVNQNLRSVRGILETY